MCYSAQIWSDYRKFEREFGAVINYRRYVEVFWQKKQDGGWQKIPKAMRTTFDAPRHQQERELADIVAQGEREQAQVFETQLFQQKTRLTRAERVLASGKSTRRAEDDQRIATDKIAAARRNLADLQRAELLPRDSRIYPGQYAPVMFACDGERVVAPMRYQCRLPGWTQAIERKYPGTYNARRNKLEKSWGALFGHQHAIMVVSAFYENVSRHALEHRALAEGEHAENVVLEFRPRPGQDLLIACLWSLSKGQRGEPDLLSFAAITDQPPPEVAAAGHDRCIIPIKCEHVDAWLNPDPRNLAAMYAILDDRQQPYYAHRLAA